MPHTPVRGYSVHGDAWLAAVAAHDAALSPCSNTGRILEPRSGDAPAFVDYVTFTLRGVRRLLSRVRRDRDAPDGLDELRAVLFETSRGDWDVTAGEAERAAALLDSVQVDCTGCIPMERLTGRPLDRGLAMVARMMVASCAPALVFGDLTGRGLNGYSDHLKIYTHLGDQCGSIAVGGNKETVHVIITGQGCHRVNMDALADALVGFDYSIGRIDAAWDDFGGRFGTVRDAKTNYDFGGFTPLRGARSKKVLFFDDCDSGSGATFQLGVRSGRLLRIYAKGQQLGDPESPWVRYELQTMGTEFVLTADHLRAPGALLSQYPDLSHLPVDATGDRAERVRRETDAKVDKLVKWLATTCGPALSLLDDSVGSRMTLDLLRSDKTPRRFRALGNSRSELGELVADALLDARKHAPIAMTSAYFSAEQREKQTCKSSW